MVCKKCYLSFHLLPTAFPPDRVQVADYLLPPVLGWEQLAERAKNLSNPVHSSEHCCDCYWWRGKSRSSPIAYTAATVSRDGGNEGEFVNGCNSWCFLIRGRTRITRNDVALLVALIRGHLRLVCYLAKEPQCISPLSPPTTLQSNGSAGRFPGVL